MNAKIVAIFIILISNFKFCQSKKYVNYSLVNTVPTELAHLEFLQKLDGQKYVDIVFWTKPYKLNKSVQFIVNRVDKDFLIERANHYNLKTEILTNNLQRLRVGTYSWEAYHTLEDIYQWLADVASTYSDKVELISIGKSAEGREIYALYIKQTKRKQKVIVEGGIHGNEWIAIEFVTYLADQLIRSNLTQNGQIDKLVKRYEWYLIPIVNPDGFAYSQHSDRLWKKNRRQLGKSIGVDLNRNYDYYFGKYGTSRIENDDNYCGPFPFSEPETQVLSDFVKNMNYGLIFYLSFHCYGQKIIIPYADGIKHVENYRETENFGKQAIEKIKQVNGSVYTIGTTYDILGSRISGSSASYIKKAFKIKYVYTFLLRDNGSYGYALPADQILPTCLETVSGVIELMTAKHKKVKTRLFNKAECYGEIKMFLILFLIIFTIF